MSPPLTSVLRRTRFRPGLGAVLSLLLVAAAAIGLAVFSQASPAAAQSCPPLSTIDDQDEFAAMPEGCRGFIVDPGVNNLNTNESLAAAMDFYINEGFDENFIWYAKPAKKTINSSTVEWTFCSEFQLSDPICQGTVGHDSVLDAFGNSGGTVILDVFEYNNMWIAAVCGNWLYTDPPPGPVPTIPVQKFIDTDRDGVRDTGEPADGGVTFELFRISSEVGQSESDTVAIDTLDTDANGQLVFELDGEGPGVYEVREQVPSGYYSTTGGVMEVVVEFGTGDDPYPTLMFGNARDTVDVEKLSVDIELPDRIDARETFTVDVDVTIINNGPADYVDVIDELDLEGRLKNTGAIDCLVDPLTDPYEVNLRIGQSETLPFSFNVTCETPSDHVFTASDVLHLDDPPLTDTNPANNTMSESVEQPVWAETDLATTTSVNCPDETDVDVAVDCTVTTVVTNDGFGPIDTTTYVTLTGLPDCTIAPGSITHPITGMTDGASETFVDTFTVECADRSFHPFTATAEISADDPHVEELNTADNTASDEFTVEVFEEADLGVVDVDVFLACNEYFEADPFGCSATAVVTNAGPADQVITDVVLNLSADGCVAQPNPQLADVVIAAGGSVEVEAAWNVACDDPNALHVIRLEVCVSNDDEEDPHADDRNSTNNCAEVVALPIDLKPLSDPNTLQIGRGGLTSVAILSTATFDPMTEVDTSRPIFFGSTGTEAEATKCATEGEDANQDGFDQDLVCKFKIADLNLTTDVEYVYLTGYLVDGTRFIGTEQVRVIDRDE